MAEQIINHINVELWAETYCKLLGVNPVLEHTNQVPSSFLKEEHQVHSLASFWRRIVHKIHEYLKRFVRD